MKIFVAGHKGMVGNAILRQLQLENQQLIVRERSELDLLDQKAVLEFFLEQKFDQVYLAAAKVGGIYANNTYPADFIYENLVIQNNIIHSSFLSNVQKLLFLGSSCIYPKLVSQPMAEDALLSGKLESTNEPYAIAKIAGIKMCESYNRQYGVDYRSVMPTNLYGPNDNFHAENSHVIPALIRRIHDAKVSGEKQVSIWGSGNAKREFLHVDDMAKACLHVMNLPFSVYSQHTQPMISHLNVGSGIDCTIRELAETLVEVIGFEGSLIFDSSKPDGTMRKLMDVSRLASLGWKSTMSLHDGLGCTYSWFLDNAHAIRR